MNLKELMEMYYAMFGEFKIKDTDPLDKIQEHITYKEGLNDESK